MKREPAAARTGVGVRGFGCEVRPVAGQCRAGPARGWGHSPRETGRGKIRSSRTVRSPPGLPSGPTPHRSGLLWVSHRGRKVETRCLSVVVGGRRGKVRQPTHQHCKPFVWNVNGIIPRRGNFSTRLRPTGRRAWSPPLEGGRPPAGSGIGSFGVTGGYSGRRAGRAWPRRPSGSAGQRGRASASRSGGCGHRGNPWPVRRSNGRD